MDPNIFLYEKNPFLFRGALNSFSQCLDLATKRTDLPLESSEFEAFMDRCVLDYVTLSAPISQGAGNFYFNRQRDGQHKPTLKPKPVVLPDLEK